jgi:peptidoglycan hydrolase-like protein with peptidoglycan-binding domain
MVVAAALTASLLLVPTTTPPLAQQAAGQSIRDLQKRLITLHYDPGKADGAYGTATQSAVWAFQKVNGMDPTGTVNARLWKALKNPRTPPSLVARGAKNRVEVSLRKQILVAYRSNKIVLISHISSGAAATPTPTGNFTAYRRIKGWRKAPLGLLYNPIYFYGGYALHGSKSVPRHPASHGCVRIPMHTAETLPKTVIPNEPVHIRH